MKYDVKKDIDAFEQKHLKDLQALADVLIGKKYGIIISRDGLSYIDKANRTIHIDPTGRLMYLYAMGCCQLKISDDLWLLFDSKDKYEIMFFYAKAALLHESLHALHTDSDAVCEYMRRFVTLTDLRVFHSVFNCIEDGFIEYYFADDLYKHGYRILSQERELLSDAIFKPKYAMTCKKSNIKLNDTTPFTDDCFANYDGFKRDRLKAVLKSLYDYLDAVLIYCTEKEWNIDELLDNFGLSELAGLKDIAEILPIRSEELDTVQRLDVSLKVYEIIKRNVDGFELLYDFFNESNIGYALCENDVHGLLNYNGWQKNYGEFIDCGRSGAIAKVIETNDGIEVVAHKLDSAADSTTVYLDGVEADYNEHSNKVKIKEYTDNRNYNTKAKEDGVRAELNYKREFSNWTDCANEFGFPELKGFSIHSVRKGYEAEQETEFQDVCLRNHADIKSVEAGLASVLLTNKRQVLRKQSMGTRLDSHSLADAKNRVFVKPISGGAADFDILLLIDVSGSVTGKAYPVLCEQTIIFTKACVNIGLSIKVQSFCSVNGIRKLYLETHKDFKESVNALSSLFGYEHGLYNSYDLLAISNVRQSLKSSTYLKHIVVYVTDGQGFYVDANRTQYSAKSCKDKIERMLRVMAHEGFAFIPVCFDSSAMKVMPTVFQGAVCCKNHSELKSKLVQRIGEELWKI